MGPKLTKGQKIHSEVDIIYTDSQDVATLIWDPSPKPLLVGEDTLNFSAQPA